LALMAAMPGILASEPDARLLIVGSGPLLRTIEGCAELVNRQCGMIVVKVVEPRPDLSKLFASARVVVATATTAMEALACGTPVIAAGRTGYLGPVDENTFEESLDLLFADHGRCPSRTSAEALSRDVVSVLEDPGRFLNASRAISNRLAAEFTPDKAAQSVLGIYETVLGQTGGHR
jgi:L-malate glycosyltransferase